MKGKRVSLLATFLVAFFYGQCEGWGQEGHKIVAQIARNRLDEDLVSKLEVFLGKGYTLAEIAPWPDTYDHTDQGEWSKPCHYCNLPKDAKEFQMSYCPDFCVVKSVHNYTSLFHAQQASPSQCNFTIGIEPCPLEFLTHYVGDIHQPLHVSYAYDEGGNEVKVSFFGKKTNLHSVWDSWMIERWNNDLSSAVKELESMIAKDPGAVKKWLAAMDPTQWADESFDYVLSTVYDFNGVMRSADEVYLGEAYYERNIPIVKQRLAAAGVRLGYLLNDLLSIN